MIRAPSPCLKPILSLSCIPDMVSHHSFLAVNAPSTSHLTTRTKLGDKGNGTRKTMSYHIEPGRTVPADWVYKIKHRGGPIDIKDLKAKQFKVIRDQFMKEGIDFNDTFAPVAKP